VIDSEVTKLEKANETLKSQKEYLALLVSTAAKVMNQLSQIIPNGAIDNYEIDQYSQFYFDLMKIEQ
jgi:hypothetical protein